MFVLKATTSGDELMAPVVSNIATSEDRQVLEQLKADRAAERAAWLARNPLPWWAEYSVIESEAIEEIPELV